MYNADRCCVRGEIRIWLRMAMKQVTLRRAVSLLALLAVSTFVVVLDQLTKMWVVNSMPEGEWWSPLPGEGWRILRVTHTTNSGAAFGMFPDRGGVFILIAAVVAVAIVLYYWKLPDGEWLIRLSLGLQLGGAIGNLLDRIRQGYVTDFLDLGFWPIFNVADASILIGVGLIVYCLWRGDHATAASSLAVADEEVWS